MKLAGKKSETYKHFDPTKAHNDYLDRIENEVKKDGVVIFEPSEGNLHIDRDYLNIPEDITDLSSRDLGNSLNAFTQQKIYLRTLLSRAENLLEATRRTYFDVSAPYYEEFTDKRLSETSKDRLINAKEEVKEYYEEWIDCKRKVALVETAIANIEDAIFLLSREVTRRGSDYDDENRDYNVGRK